MSYFSVKNYEQFQHYKDRSPPWIKFYNSVLDDYEFTRLPDTARSHLVAIWLLASRTSNRIPYDAGWVGMAIKASTPVDLAALAKAGFILPEQPCSEPLASCAQEARPEREKRESREETEQREKEAHEAVRADVLPPELIPDPRKAIFDDGLRWLAKAVGRPERGLRGMLGRWIKVRGDPDVAAALVAAQQNNPVDPIAWIEARLKSNGQRKPSDLQRRRALAEEFLGLDVGEPETGGATGDQAPASETISGVPDGPSRRY